MRNLLKPLKEGRVRLLLNAGDHASMQASLKKCLKGMGVDFKVIDPVLLQKRAVLRDVASIASPFILCFVAPRLVIDVSCRLSSVAAILTQVASSFFPLSCYGLFLRVVAVAKRLSIVQS